SRGQSRRARVQFMASAWACSITTTNGVSMKPIIVTSITPQQYQGFLAKLRAEKNVLVEPSATGGRASCHGVVVEWTYANNTITATPISKPFFITEGYID